MDASFVVRGAMALRLLSPRLGAVGGLQLSMNLSLDHPLRPQMKNGAGDWWKPPRPRKDVLKGHLLDASAQFPLGEQGCKLQTSSPEMVVCLRRAPGSCAHLAQARTSPMHCSPWTECF